MQWSGKYLVVGCSMLALAAGGAGVAVATSGGDGDEQATGPGADRAKRAAIELVGGGRATGVEREEDGGAVWEVEVKRPDGSTVEVRLDGGYKRAGAEREGGGDVETSDDAD